MRVGNRPSLVLACTMIVTAALAAFFLDPLSRASRIDEPRDSQLTQAREDFGRVLARPGSGDWRKALRSHGFESRRASNPVDATRLDENIDDCAGRGAYMVSRLASSKPLLISAPHRAADRHTGTLTMQLFVEGGLAAAGWNSAPRRSSETCSHASDLARSDKNHFTAFSLAFADRFPGGRVVQLHGFDRELRNSRAGSDADVILSNGTQEAGEVLLDIADCMSQRLAPRKILVYPNDVDELGALSNAQGQALRDNGFGGFVHVEMSLDLRRHLTADENERIHFLSCLSIGLDR